MKKKIFGFIFICGSFTIPAIAQDNTSSKKVPENTENQNTTETTTTTDTTNLVSTRKDAKVPEQGDNTNQPVVPPDDKNSVIVPTDKKPK